MSAEEGLADYLLDHYGSCVRGPECWCLKPEGPGWLGRACPDWRSFGARNYAELAAAHQKYHEEWKRQTDGPTD